MSSFNGWPIVSAPATPAPRSIEWNYEDVIGAARNPFTLGQQLQDWQAGILRASVSYPPMDAASARGWIAFLAGLRGTLGVFSFGDPVMKGPQNSGATGGSVSGSGQTGFVLSTSSSGLLPGDWFSLGLRMYMVTSVAGGLLGIWPQIRESPAGGTALALTNPTGLFRLVKNDRAVSLGVAKHYGITFEIEEAL